MGGRLLIAERTDFQFVVEVVNKTQSHPYFGNGTYYGFSINKVEGAELVLLRNVTYFFFMATTQCVHPM